MGSTPRTLNMGCGHRLIIGALNHDAHNYGVGADIFWDMRKENWPTHGSYDGIEFPLLNHFEEVHCRDVLEHIDPGIFYRVMGQIWDIMTTGGRLHIQVPEHGSENLQIDPSHYRGFHLRSFDLLDPDTKLGRNSWTGPKKWKVVKAKKKPRSGGNLVFLLEKRMLE